MTEKDEADLWGDVRELQKSDGILTDAGKILEKRLAKLEGAIERAVKFHVHNISNGQSSWGLPVVNDSPDTPPLGVDSAIKFHTHNTPQVCDAGVPLSHCPHVEHLPLGSDNDIPEIYHMADGQPILKGPRPVPADIHSPDTDKSEECEHRWIPLGNDEVGAGRMHCAKCGAQADEPDKPQGSWVCQECGKDWGDGTDCELWLGNSRMYPREEWKLGVWICKSATGHRKGCGETAVKWIASNPSPDTEGDKNGYWSCLSCGARQTVSCCKRPNLDWVGEDDERFDAEWEADKPSPWKPEYVDYTDLVKPSPDTDTPTAHGYEVGLDYDAPPPASPDTDKPDELKPFNCPTFQHNCEEMSEAIAALDMTIEERDAQVDEIERLKAEIDKINTSCEYYNEENRKWRSTTARVIRERDVATAKIKSYKGVVSDRLEKIDALRTENAELKDEIKARTESIHTQDKTIAKLDTKNAALKADLAKAQEKIKLVREITEANADLKWPQYLPGDGIARKILSALNETEDAIEQARVKV